MVVLGYVDGRKQLYITVRKRGSRRAQQGYGQTQTQTPRKTWTPGYLLWRWRKGPQSEGAGSLCDEKSESLHNSHFSSEAGFGLLAPRSIENKYMHSEAMEAGVTYF